MILLLATPGGNGFGAMLWLILLVIYLVPSIIAFSRKHPHRLLIFVMNLFLGWTLFGWVGALIWSLIGSDVV